MQNLVELILDKDYVQESSQVASQLYKEVSSAEVAAI